MFYECLILETDEEKGIAKITLNRPEAMNSWNDQITKEFLEAVKSLEKNRKIKALIITGSGGVFSTGADLKFVKGLMMGEDIEKGREMIETLNEAFTNLEKTRMPVIAAVNGFALAGGLELILCCDIVLAADTARIGDYHAKFGLIPGGGGSIRLPKKVGDQNAKYLLFTARWVTPEEAKEMGLVYKVVPADKLMEEAESIAATIGKRNPGGLKFMKYLANKARDLPVEEGLKLEQEIFLKFMAEERDNLLEGLTAFEQKREPVWK
ncbi:MAG: enoyl-CoA hydratase/isomerase family protein [Candidatus Jordarchaeum sp.]|uniref:enoyl-CoA hydratase/isomerase family protein n=1 Tax=Candidatus Jordarchaeum sp. TaxID=2823881 RepID=UPI00404B91CB